VIQQRRTPNEAIQGFGYKENFDGLVVCTAPLHANEVHERNGGSWISLAGFGVFEELYVRRQVDDHTYQVFFDLN